MEQLSRDRWVDILSQDHTESEERAVLVRRLKTPYTLSVPKGDWKRVFPQFQGMALRKGEPLQIVDSGHEARSVDLPEWAVAQLGLDPQGYVCVSQRNGSRFLRRFSLEEGRTTVPGRVIIDSFENAVARRRHFSSTALDDISPDLVNDLLGRISCLKYDPLTAFGHLDGSIGFMARIEFAELGLENPQKEREFTEQVTDELTSSQLADGSWGDEVVTTAFDLLRFIELGESRENSAVDRAVDWLLNTPEPLGLPGFFMATLELLREHNEDRSRGESGLIYAKVNRKGAARKYRQIWDIYNSNADVFAGNCEAAYVTVTAVALESLLRLGLEDEPRVRRAINTLLRLWNGRWCGCAVDGRDIPALDSSPDFSMHPIPNDNKTLYRLRWFTDERQIRDWNPRVGHRFWDLDEGQVLVESLSVGMGDCTFAVHRALSYHPDYRHSNLETIAALEYSRRQSALGGWGNTPPSRMLDQLRRLSHPLAAFLTLRTIPLLRRTQAEDGLWDDADLLPGRPRGGEPHKRPQGLTPRTQGLAPRELATFRILRALKEFGFLDRLLPGNRSHSESECSGDEESLPD